MYRFDEENAVETWQITHDDFLKSGRFSGGPDTRLMKYASRRIGENLYRLSFQKLAQALVLGVGEDVESDVIKFLMGTGFRIKGNFSTMGTMIYQETGVLCCDRISVVRYKLG